MFLKFVDYNKIMPCLNNYKCISNIGCNPNSAVSDPLTYSIGETLDQKMLHGSSAAIFTGQYSRNSQLYLSQYCAVNWDGFCEIASRDETTSYANNMDALGFGDSCMGLTQGEMLIYNTARRKYLVDAGNSTMVKEQFDPTVADSPYIYYWKLNDCNSMSAMCGLSRGSCGGARYAVDASKIDSDIVMNKILCNPGTYSKLLKNIYTTMSCMGTLSSLSGTKLGNYFNSYQFKMLLN